MINHVLVIFVPAFLAVVFGLVAALFPIGVTARIGVVLMVAGTMLVGWLFRSTRFSLRLSYIRWLGACVLLLSVVWPRYIFIHYGGLPGVNLYTLSTMIFLCVIVFSFLASKEFSKSIFSLVRPVSSVGWLFLIWYLWAIVSGFLGVYAAASVSEVIKEIVYVGSFFLFGIVMMISKTGRREVIQVIVLGSLFVGLLAAYEVANNANPLFRFASLGGEASNTASVVALASEKMRDGAFRVQSTFGHPIVLAQYIGAVLPIVAVYAFTEKKLFWRWIAIICLPLLFGAIVKTGSRSALLALFSAASVFFSVIWLRLIVQSKVARPYLVLAVPIISIAVAIVGYALIEFAIGRSQQEYSSTSVRIDMFKAAMSALEASPIYGFGYGMAPAKAGVVNMFGVLTLDNYYLNLVLDYGSVGLVLFLLLVAVISWKLLQIGVSSRSRDAYVSIAALSGIWAIVSVQAVLSIHENLTMLWVLAWLGLSVRSRASDGVQIEVGPRSTPSSVR